MATAVLTTTPPPDTFGQRLQAVPGLRQGLILIGLALAIAAGIWLYFWSQEPGYVSLYAGLSDRDAAEVTAALRSNRVAFKLDRVTGAVMVPHAAVHDARLQLAAQGLPQGGSRVGIEGIQGDQGFGVSQFVEGARYQHALEIELARTIATLRPVRDARVHLALPKPSAFARSREPAGASVVLDLVPGGTLEPNQVAAVVHMVATSIPELSPERVTVVDQTGRLLTQTDPNSEEAASTRQFEQARRLEASYIQRVRELLEPLAGPGRTSVQVTVDMDFAAVEEAREVYANDPAKLRSEQTSESTSNEATPVGIPGALANTPPGEDDAERVANGASSRSATRNYELDRTLTHTRLPGGRVRRVSAAVLVDHIPGLDDEGAPILRALGEDELARVEALVREAIGFDAARGDSVSVMNAAFVRTDEVTVEPTAQPLWQAPWLKDMLRTLAGAVIVLVLVFGVLRPLLRQLLASPVGGPAPLPAPRPGPGQIAAPRPAESPPEEESEPDVMMPPSGYEKRLEFAKKAVNDDPKRVAQVVKGWVGHEV